MTLVAGMSCSGGGDAYRALLERFPEDRQGEGEEPTFTGRARQPMTEALVLAAETLRYRSSRPPEGLRRVRSAVDWLVDASDLDGDGRPGWGLPHAWDAFGDGSVNPPAHPYTITTAIVLLALLDALRPEDLLTADERRAVGPLLGSVALRWCRDAWSDDGHFWYSTARIDSRFTPNVSSMMLGALARLVDEQPGLLSPGDRTFVAARVDAAAGSVARGAGRSPVWPSWPYAPADAEGQSVRPNDLVHHAYTLWGMELYRATSDEPLPWTRAEAVASLDSWWDGDRLMEFPHGATSPKDASTRPARLWGAGMMLAFHARWGSDESAARAARAIGERYGPIPDLTLHPADADTRFFARHAAHVLYGLALRAFGPEVE